VSERSRVADFWDEVLAHWISNPGDPTAHLGGPLPDWFASYAGTGDGAVDLTCYPDPYVGDLRGDDHSVRSVVLGLNPGIGYPSLQGHDGLWTGRIRQHGYSNCFQRSPAEDPDAWIRLHGKPSQYWKNLVTFARRWLDDQDADVHDILNLELYPWHSKAIAGPMTPPAHLIHDYVWAPLMEVDTPVVFAFGAAYFDACDDLELLELGRWGQDGAPFPGLDEDRGWRVAAHRLPSGQVVAVSAQPGYSGPPGPTRLEILRQLLGSLDSSTAGSAPVHDQPQAPGAGVVMGPEAASQPDRGPAPPPYVQAEEERVDEYWQRALHARRTVSELHQRGYQWLRIVPGVSGSGMDWRCVLVPAGKLTGRAGFTIAGELMELVAWQQDPALADRHPQPPIVLWGPPDRRTILGVPDADHLTPREVAERLIVLFPGLIAESRGTDWAYAGWFLERLWDAQNGLFPIAYDNWDYYADHSDELWMCPTADDGQLVTRPLPPRPLTVDTSSASMSASERRRDRLTWQPGDLEFIGPSPGDDQTAPPSTE
jgi:hypothetical protein